MSDCDNCKGKKKVDAMDNVCLYKVCPISRK
jgi:hypothetical protein